MIYRLLTGSEQKYLVVFMLIAAEICAASYISLPTLGAYVSAEMQRVERETTLLVDDIAKEDGRSESYILHHPNVEEGRYARMTWERVRDGKVFPALALSPTHPFYPCLIQDRWNGSEKTLAVRRRHPPGTLVTPLVMENFDIDFVDIPCDDPSRKKKL